MRSIRTHLVVSLTAGLLLLLGVAGLGLYEYMEEVLEHSLDAQLSAKAQAIAGAVHEEEDGQPHLHLPESPPMAGPRDQGPFYFQIWRGDGSTLARQVAPSCGSASVPAQIKHGRHFADSRMPDGEDVRLTRLVFTAQPDEDLDTRHAVPSTRAAEQLVLVVAHNRDAIDRALALLLTGLLFAAALLVTGILLTVNWGVRRSLRPLAEVGQLADQIGPDSLNLRFPAGNAVPDELRPIAAKLNELLERVAAAFAHERRFSAAVAHELRTPVSELLSVCEVTLRWPDDKDAVVNALKEAKAISSEMGTVVENLMSLARCQAGLEKPQTQVIALADMVGELWSPLRARALDRQLQVQIEIAPELRFCADRRMLAIVLRNLLANAADYADVGGRLRILCEGSVLKIGNDARSLETTDVPHLTEAFWRKDSARTGGDHAGLGLAIVLANCRAAGIEFRQTLRQDRWFEASLKLPPA